MQLAAPGKCNRIAPWSAPAHRRCWEGSSLRDPTWISVGASSSPTSVNREQCQQCSAAALDVHPPLSADIIAAVEVPARVARISRARKANGSQLSGNAIEQALVQIGGPLWIVEATSEVRLPAKLLTLSQGLRRPVTDFAGSKPGRSRDVVWLTGGRTGSGVNFELGAQGSAAHTAAYPDGWRRGIVFQGSDREEQSAHRSARPSRPGTGPGPALGRELRSPQTRVQIPNGDPRVRWVSFTCPSPG